MSSIPDYDTYAFKIDEKHEDILERIIVKNNLSGGKFAIDLGGGYGRLTNLLVDRYDYVFLTDYSLRNLRIAKNNIVSSNITYVACDIRDPPFIDNVFDFGMSIRVFHHYSDLYFLPNILRKISPGGNLLFNFNNLDSPVFLFSLAKNLFSQKRNRVNPFEKITQKVDVENGSRNLYFTTFKQVLSRIPDEGEVMKIFGAGLLHNQMFESLDKKLNIQRIVEFEVILGKFQKLTRLFPDVFITLKRKGDLCPNIKDPNSILLCKKCYGTIHSTGDSMQCSECGARYPIVEGIIDLR